MKNIMISEDMLNFLCYTAYNEGRYDTMFHSDNKDYQKTNVRNILRKFVNGEEACNMCSSNDSYKLLLEMVNKTHDQHDNNLSSEPS